jgi:hypothetical protein
MGAFLRSIGLAMAVTAVTGNLIDGKLDGVGQVIGDGFVLLPNDPVHIDMANMQFALAMVKTEELLFTAAIGTLGALDKVGANIERVVTTVSGAYESLHQQISQVEWDKLSQEGKEWAEKTARTLNIPISLAAEKLFSIAEDNLPAEIVQWIADHPGQTVFIVTGGVVYFAPHLLTVPVLTSLGFTTTGVAPGELINVTAKQYSTS